jgi:hypothetical protein
VAAISKAAHIAIVHQIADQLGTHGPSATLTPEDLWLLPTGKNCKDTWLLYFPHRRETPTSPTPIYAFARIP